MATPSRTSGNARVRRMWSHPSVRALLQANPDESDPEAIVRAKAREMVATAKSSYGWKGPPFDVEVLADLRGIKVRPAPLDVATDALIRTLPNGGLEILCRPDLAPTRRNFSIAHEISHTFFPDCYEMVRRRSGDQGRFDPDKELEGLCDIGAAEILMPHDEFAADLKSVGFSLEAVDVLRKRYEASREATAIRMLRLTKEPVAVAFLSLRLKPTEARRASGPARPGIITAKPRLRVEFMAASDAYPYDVLPKHKSIPDASNAYRHLERDHNGGAMYSEAWPPARAAGAHCRIESAAIPPDGDGQPRVLAIVRPGHAYGRPRTTRDAAQGVGPVAPPARVGHTADRSKR